MNAIQLNSRGGPEALRYGPAAVPRAGAGEILVRVRAAAVTPTELLWDPTWTTRAGEPRPFPIIPGHEFSGEVHGLGPGEKDVAVGSVGLEEADDADDTDMGAPSHCDRGIPAPYSELPLCHGHLRVSPRVTHGLHLG